MCKKRILKIIFVLVLQLFYSCSVEEKVINSETNQIVEVGKLNPFSIKSIQNRIIVSFVETQVPIEISKLDSNYNINFSVTIQPY